MTCKACDLVAADPRAGVRVAGCLECDARELARSPAAWRAYAARDPDDLRALMVATFGEPASEGYKTGRAAVDRWYRQLCGGPRP